jgi:transcription initiation factor TFIIIB Brf1 subunit/transcription initiation factor TFIIB
MYGCPICGETVILRNYNGDYSCAGCGDTLTREEIEASFAPPVEAPSPERVIAVNPQTGEWASFVRGDDGGWCRIVKNADDAPQMTRRVPTNVDPLTWDIQLVNG